MAYDFGRYLKIRGAWGASWSPDGGRVAFLTEITGVPQLWEVPAGGGWPEQRTFHEERVSGAEYSPTGDGILFGMDAGGMRLQGISPGSPAAQAGLQTALALKLEREHFVALAQMPKTQERIGHMLKTGKPLRN